MVAESYHRVSIWRRHVAAAPPLPPVPGECGDEAPSGVDGWRRSRRAKTRTSVHLRSRARFAMSLVVPMSAKTTVSILIACDDVG